MGWRLRGDTLDLELRWHPDVPGSPDQRSQLDRRAAYETLRRLLPSWENLRRLRRLLAERLPSLMVERLDDPGVLEQVAWRIEAGRIDARLQRYKPAVYVDRQVTEYVPPEAVLVAPRVATWIEIQLVDEDCEPVPGQHYRITLPDGSTLQGRLDYLGKARVDDIYEGGACTVTFPDLDTDAWRSDVTCPETVVAAPPYVEFELVDMEGDPVPGVLYRVTLPDGSLHEGYLDERGSVRYEGMPSGQCRITFPDLDAEAWEAVPDA